MADALTCSRLDPLPATPVDWTLPYAYCEATYTATGSTRSCDQHYVLFDSDDYGNNPDAPVICHEVGHTVGLTHGPDASSPALSYGDPLIGCMRTAPLTTDTSIGVHNTGEINRIY